MSRLRLLALVLVGVLAVTVGVWRGAEHRGAGPAGDAARTPPRSWAQATLASMSLEQKVGQLFVTYAYGERADTANPTYVAKNRERFGVDTPAQVVAKYHLGGVIYFGWAGNVVDPRQVAALSNGLQRAAGAGQRGVPLLVGADQETGLVTRLGAPFTELPGSMAIGAGRSAADACTAARITGQELRAVGVNQNYAPVADVNADPRGGFIGVRAFGEDPALVAEMSAAQVRCYQQVSVAATAKHFPGHGGTATDSHVGLPVIDHTRDQWERLDVPPFAASISAGVDSVLVGHVAMPELDPTGTPATLSRPILTGLLRERLGYDGVVVTDSLEMQAVRDRYPDAQVPVLALRAGVDMLLMPPVGAFDTQYRAVLDAVRAGTLTERRVDESVLRVLELKARLGLSGDPFVDEEHAARSVGTRAHRDAAQRLTDRSVTLLRDDARLLPLRPGQRVLVTGQGPAVPALAAKLAAHGMVARGLPAASPAQVVAAARGSDVTVVATRQAWNDPGQRQVTDALADSGRPVVTVAVRDPRDAGYAPPRAAVVVTYGETGVSMESLARMMTGEIAPLGRLPVTVPAPSGGTAFPIGAGLGQR